MKLHQHIFLALLGLTASAVVNAQAYPARTVNVIVGYPAGGGMDTFCRMVATAVSSRTGQPFVVQNRPGAEGHIGLTTVARATPDGYTISCVPHSMTQSPHMTPIGIDVQKDLAPVAKLARWQFALVARTEGGINSLTDFIAAAKAKPGTISVGTAGAATRLANALLEQRAEIKLLTVPFPGTSSVQTALLGGHVSAAVADTTIAKMATQQSAGPHALKLLAVMSAKRDPAMPDVPAIAEFLPGLDLSAWYGLVAPAGTPAEVISRLNTEFTAAVNSSPLKEQLAAKGWFAETSTADEFEKIVKADYARYGAVVRSTGMRNP